MRFLRPVYLFIALGAVTSLRSAEPVPAPGAFSPDALAAALCHAQTRRLGALGASADDARAQSGAVTLR